MGKIVVVSASPRKKGYTMKMVKIFEESIKKLDSNIEFEYIYLIQKNLKYCIGCCRCLTEGGHNCPIEDDAKKILETMHSADGLIFAAPGYAHAISGLFKNFVDRFMYLDHIPEFVGIPATIISTSGAEGIMKPPKYISEWAITWWGCNVVDLLGIGSSFFIANEKYRQKSKDKLKKAAENFYKELNRKTPKKPSFLQYQYFMFNKGELLIAPTANPYRAKVWKENGWLDSDYYYKVSINPLFKIFGAFLVVVMKLIYRKMMGKNANEKLQQYLDMSHEEMNF